MKRILLLFLLTPGFVFSQIQYKKVTSSVLGSDRVIQIQLPRTYSTSPEKSYPVIITLDGDYLFELVAGNVNYYSYWDEIPEAIVVGILQQDSRLSDVEYDKNTYLPINNGAKFYEFIGGELLPKIDKNYRTTNLDILVGFDMTANFINYYLFKKKPLFRGYINISPDFAPKMHKRIIHSLKDTPFDTWYYMATSSDDVPRLKKDIKSFNAQLDSIDNEKVHYSYDNFKNTAHYALPGFAIPSALLSIFKPYRPISHGEMDKVIKNKQSPLAYLKAKYKRIKELYGIDLRIRIADYMRTADAIDQLKLWDEYKDLAKSAIRDYPEKMMGLYFMGRYYEETGKYKKAILSYQEAYALNGVLGLTPDMALERADKLKEDFK